jgi:hypothetical protein
MMHIHKYDLWKDITREEVFSVSTIATAALEELQSRGKEPSGRVRIQQERRCLICGKVKLRTETA